MAKSVFASSFVSASFVRLLPVFAAGFLQACSDPRETIVDDKTQETRYEASRKAEQLNRSAAKVLSDMRRTAFDGVGHVFFKDGVGIVYPKGLALAESAVVEQSFCIDYHPETLLHPKKCAKLEIESLATLPVIHSPVQPLYINSIKSVVCPGKPSALFSLTDMFDQNRDKSPCKDISPASLPTVELYRSVTKGIKATTATKIGQPALEWANIMPTSM